MLVTDKFVFIHLHKTGGRFIIGALQECMSGARLVGYHYPRSLLPAEAIDLPVIGFIRNPWSWYVSWYAFNQENPGRNPIYRVVSAENTHSFKDTILNMLELGMTSDRGHFLREQVAASLPSSIEGNMGSGITSACIRGMAGVSTGYLTWLVSRMYGAGELLDDVMFGRQESLRRDLLNILEYFSVEITDDFRKLVLSVQPINASRHGMYANYYDVELMQKIARVDAPIIERFSYAF